MNKRDDPTIIFFNTSLFWDKGTSTAEVVFLKSMVLHLYQLPLLSIPLVSNHRQHYINLSTHEKRCRENKKNFTREVDGDKGCLILEELLTAGGVLSCSSKYNFARPPYLAMPNKNNNLRKSSLYS